jgi:hypothetical protein
MILVTLSSEKFGADGAELRLTAISRQRQVEIAFYFESLATHLHICLDRGDSAIFFDL